VVIERLNDKTIGQFVQRAAGMIGLDAAKYGGHSLRAGCATAAAAAGAGEIGIMKRTGHKSLAVLSRYVRHGSLFSVDPLAKAL
jgi:integrase